MRISLTEGIKPIRPHLAVIELASLSAVVVVIVDSLSSDLASPPRPLHRLPGELAVVTSPSISSLSLCIASSPSTTASRRCSSSLPTLRQPINGGATTIQLPSTPSIQCPQPQPLARAQSPVP